MKEKEGERRSEGHIFYVEERSSCCPDGRAMEKYKGSRQLSRGTGAGALNVTECEAV